ncbi:hypothetical protein KY314_02025 [Candidatus Woesearchaeota archaeon]|nr:hypothetical protein [Candidatus Woesearchaeota archaeon]
MKKIIFLLLLFLLGCYAEKSSIIAPGVVLDLGEVDYSNFKVSSLAGEGQCAGTSADPCYAIAKFQVKEKISINPMQLLEIDTAIKQVKGYNKKAVFEPGHDYTLKYEVLKINPTDTIVWKFAGVE